MSTAFASSAPASALDPSAIMSSILSISRVKSGTFLLVRVYRSGISAAMKSGKKSAAGEARTPRSTAQHASWTSVKACARG